jgi:hypothetical protein
MSRRESHCWARCWACMLLGVRVAQRVVAGKVAKSNDPLTDKAPAESQGESLLDELLGMKVDP